MYYKKEEPVPVYKIQQTEYERLYLCNYGTPNFLFKNIQIQSGRLNLCIKINNKNSINYIKAFTI